jgi:hypothetical protein
VNQHLMALLDTAYTALVSNQLLVGGVGTLAFGSLMYALRTVPQKMMDIVERTVWTTVSVENMSNEYRDVDAFIEGRRLDFFSRSLEIKDGYLKTGFGGGWGTYDGTLFKYSKTRSVIAAARSPAATTAALRFFLKESGCWTKLIPVARCLKWQPKNKQSRLESPLALRFWRQSLRRGLPCRCG